MTLPGKPRRKPMSPRMVFTAEARFWAKVAKGDGCWSWTAATNGVGYGILAMSRDGSKVLAHRFSYELVNGPIPDGLVVDHLCSNPRCVRPSHLEAVTQAVNTLRGLSPAAQQARQVTCRRGHDFAPGLNSAGRRYCKRCHSLGESIRYYRRQGRPIPQHLWDEFYGSTS